MRLERSFGPYSPEAPSFRVREPIRNTTEFEQFVVPREIILFSRSDEKKDAEVLHQESKEDQADEQVPAPANENWESFNTEPYPSHNFVNLYAGPFSAQMELNRKNAERLLEVGGIEGKLILVDLPMDRSRSIAGVNPDGSVTGRRRLFWGEKIEEEKPQALVKSIPAGWRIEIPGQDIMEELSRQESKKPLDKRFITRVNQIMRDSIGKIIIREKLSSEKDELFKARLISFVGMPIVGIAAAISLDTVLPAFMIAYTPVAYALVNFFGLDGTSLLRGRKKLNSMYEIFMPSIEFDRVARGLAFVNLKGRNLVRLRKEK